MARPQPVQQLALLETILRRYPQGASIPELARELMPPPETRTLERWLGMLIEQGRAIQIQGGDNARYGAAPASAPAAAVTSPAPAETEPESIDDRFAELFEEAVADIIICGMPPVQATPALQLQAARVRLPAEQRLAYVVYAKDRLEKLTREDANEIGVLPEQYDAWRQKWTAPQPGTSPRVSPVVATAPSGVGSKPPAAAMAPDEPEDPVVQLAQPQPAAQAATAGTAAAATATADNDEEEMEDILKGIGLGHLIPTLKATIRLGKELFTWKRFALSLVWGLLIAYITVRAFPGIMNLYMLQVPLTGLVWYVFLRSARRRGGQKANKREIITAIAGGGAATSFLVGIFLPMLIQISNKFG